MAHAQDTSPLDLSGYDFLDFGASKGGCIDFAISRLGGRKGLGVDNDPKKIEQMREAGYDCIAADATGDRFPSRAVRFVTMSHFLEHLPNQDAVRAALAIGARTARDFLFIQGPYFDGDDYLRSLGLKFYWSDWHGHRCHVTTQLLATMLDSLGLRHYMMMARKTVETSDDPAIHPLSSPRDQSAYVAGDHPPKPSIAFGRPLYHEMVCLVRLRRFVGWQQVLDARRGCSHIGGTLPARSRWQWWRQG